MKQYKYIYIYIYIYQFPVFHPPPPVAIFDEIVQNVKITENSRKAEEGLLGGLPVHSTYRALDTIIRNLFFDLIAVVTVPAAEKSSRRDFPANL